MAFLVGAKERAPSDLTSANGVLGFISPFFVGQIMHQHLASLPPGLERLRASIRFREQRAATRYPTCRGATIRRLLSGTGERESAVLCDVSERGLGLFTLSRFQAGMILFVEFDGARVRPKSARVRHATENEDGIVLGCELDDPLTDAELQALRERE